jgi:hypothetical protein
MRSIGFAAVALCVALSSCGTIEKLSQTNVPVKAIIVAANGVDAASTAATAYVRYCTPNPSPVGCDDKVIKTQILPAVHDVRTARDTAEQFLIDNPNATLGPSTLVDAVTKAVGALQTILNTNNIPVKS